MKIKVPESLVLIAGRFEYPFLLAEAARRAGVRRIEVIAFKGETSRKIGTVADEVHWLNLGSMQRFLETLQGVGIEQVIMAGQIAPSNLFTLRMDRLARELYRSLRVHTAHSIFGAVVAEIEKLGLEVLPGHTFMEVYMPEAGQLSARAPSEREWADIALGLEVVKGTSDYEIGQTVAIKEGVIIAVEALEGTNATIRRAGKVGRRGTVIVKVPKRGHDMRFDIPVVGETTFRVMKRAGVSCLAVEAGRTILLRQDRLKALADAQGMAFVAVEVGDDG
jgi:UDP-2,3-diacylglucosamine hydrolase